MARNTPQIQVHAIAHSGSDDMLIKHGVRIVSYGQGVRISDKSGVRISSRSGVRISNYCGVRISGKSGVRISNHSGVRISSGRRRVAV